MASFSAFLEVGGSRYPLTYYDLYLHQQTDQLGRPASLTQGGTLTCELHTPDQRDTVLTDWMVSPSRQYDGFVHLYREDTKAKLKTISFFNAYCVNMGVHFSATGTGPMLTSLVISPQRVAVGAVVHDNNWPAESHGAGITHTPPSAEQEPGLLSDIAHTVLDVAGLVPVIGELADGANALFYLAEGNKTDAALSAAAMIPVAGMAATGGKLARKGFKYLSKAGKLKKLKLNRVENVLSATKRKAEALVERLPEHTVDPPFKRSKKHNATEFDNQLSGQEKGLNDLTVDEYLTNRDRYLKEGRVPEGTLAQKQAREKALRDKQAELRKGGKSKEAAKEEAQKWLDSQNALHNPDQIAGGHPEKIEGMGDAGVNKSVGSQWDKHKRAEKLDEHVRKHAETMTPTQRKKTKLNVRLPKVNR